MIYTLERIDACGVYGISRNRWVLHFYSGADVLYKYKVYIIG
jgi:hypothetical protein